MANETAVASKDDKKIERVELEMPPAGPWRDRCSALCRAMREQILVYFGWN